MILFSCRCAKKKKNVKNHRCVKELLENSSTLSNNIYQTVARKILQIKSSLVSICPDIKASGESSGVTNTRNGERGTGNGERVHSGNPYKNSKWRTKTQKQSEM